MTSLTRTTTTDFEIGEGELRVSAVVDLDGVLALIAVEGCQAFEEANLALRPREARRLAAALLEAAQAVEDATEQP